MSNGILVFCEHENGIFKRSAHELLSKAKEIQTSLGSEVSAVYIGEAAGESLGAYGASKAYQIAGDGFDANNTGAAARAIQAAISAANPQFVLAAASPQGKDIMPRLSARLRAGLGSEVTELRLEDGQLIGRRPQFAGKAFSDVRVLSPIKIFTSRPNSFPVAPAGEGKAVVEKLSVALEDGDGSYSQIGVEASTAVVVDLTEADRIVSGGRSVKSKESYDSLIRPLAASINATPGASRAAVDAGYAAHSEQVGQTGKVVNPSLYIACGISGAIQHLAGMRTSRVIVAINKDRDAPIFSHATYGIVADMFKVCPVLTKALSGGEIPVVAAPAKAEPEQAKSEAKTPTAKKAAPAAKARPSLRNFRKKQEAKEEESTSASAKSTAATHSSSPQPTAAAVAFDPAVLDGVKSQIKELHAEISKLRDEWSRSLKDNNGDLKKEIQRVEQNARSFQQGGLKRYEDLDGKVVAEVRKVREILRKGIRNDTEDLREGNSSLRNIAVAAVVMNILSLALLVVVLIKVLGS